MNRRTALAGCLVAALTAVACAGTGDIPTQSRGPSPEACAAAAAYSAERRGVAVLVLRNGRVVCEQYAGEGAADRAFPLHSGVKSFSGVMAAAAAQDGFLQLDEKVSDTITEWRSDPLKSQITIRQLLNLTSGVPGGQVGRTPTYADAIKSEAVAPTGTRYAYGPTPYQIFGEVMRRKLQARGLGNDPLAYLERRIFEPIGLRYARWARTGGDAHLPNGAELTAREWAKFGEFVRNRGRVGRRQLVDPKTFSELFEGSAANPAYGVTWWLARNTGEVEVRMPGGAFDFSTNADKLPRDLATAAGAGDQRLYVIPSEGLTVVRFAYFDVAALVAAGQRPQEARQDARRELRRNPERRWSDTAFIQLLLGKTAG